MKTFNQLLSEIPHVLVKGNEIAIDLELEMKGEWSLSDVVEHFKKLLKGESVQSKNPKHKFTLPAESTEEFAKKLLKLPFLRTWATQRFGEEGWNEIEAMLRSRIS